MIGENVVDSDSVLHLRLSISSLIAFSGSLSRRLQRAIDLDPTRTPKTELPFVDPQVFEIFVHWILFSRLRIIDSKFKATLLWKTLDAEEALIAWQLGQELLAPVFQDACVDRLIEIFGTASSLPIKYLKQVYNITDANTNSGLRRLFRAMMCEDQLPVELRKNEKQALEDIGKDSLLEYKAERKKNKTVWKNRKEGHVVQGQGPWRSGGCAFHEHALGETCGVLQHGKSIKPAALG